MIVLTGFLADTICRSFAEQDASLRLVDAVRPKNHPAEVLL